MRSATAHKQAMQASIRARLERRGQVAQHPTLCGIDFVQAVQQGDGWRLYVYFIPSVSSEPKSSIPATLTIDSIRFVRSGEEVSELRVQAITPSETAPHILVVDVEWRIVIDDPQQHLFYVLDLQAVIGLDPWFARSAFFLLPTLSVDPKPIPHAALSHTLEPEPHLDYLAKDYLSFRHMMLEQLSRNAPEWRSRNVADLGIMLVELLAYAGDYMSYYQDAVATEAYLATARQRMSIRRHARLLDYHMHHGSNARAWVQLQVEASEGVPLACQTPLLTAAIGSSGPRVYVENYQEVYAQNRPLKHGGHHIFETLEDATLWEAHNRMDLYTSDHTVYTLAEGATTATLAGSYSQLKEGDVLIFEVVDERLLAVLMPTQLERAHAVRLNAPPTVTKDPDTGDAITEITWHTMDALPRPFPVTIHLAGYHATAATAVRGNIVLADYGRTIVKEPLSLVPGHGTYGPQLRYGDLTYAASYHKPTQRRLPATGTLAPPERDAHARIHLHDRTHKQRWRVRQDLLRSDRFAPDFVVETGFEGYIMLRFGNNVFGRKPSPHTQFEVTYRIGNGQVGNVGTGAIKHVVTDDTRISLVRNPLPARGGRDPENLEDVVLLAPEAFKVQKRAVTLDDFVAFAKKQPHVLDAVAQLTWKNNWADVNVFVAAEKGNAQVSVVCAHVATALEPYRLLGYRLQVLPPTYVPLIITLKVVVETGYVLSAVQRQLQETFSTKMVAPNDIGFFAPEQFVFGQPLYRSQVVARAIGVAGIVQVKVVQFERLQARKATPSTPVPDQIDVQATEIIRLDNDPFQPKNGHITFILRHRDAQKRTDA